MAAKPFDGFGVSWSWAHDQLRSADPSTTTVTQVAAQPAFIRSSRVPAACRQTVGERPCDTLRGS
jgi:hypothetical protein